MSYTTILINEYKAKIDSINSSYEAFRTMIPAPPVDPDSGGVPEPPKPNSGSVVLTNVSTLLSQTNTSIFNAIKGLFDDPEDEEHIPDLNYQIINGYADGSKTYEYYDKNTEEFSERGEYYFTRGNLYDMIPGVEAGDYLYRYVQNMRVIYNLCDQYEKMYQEYTPPTVEDSSDSGTTTAPPKIVSFWSEYISDFRDTVNENIAGFNDVRATFNSITPLVANYKDLMYRVSMVLGKIENFIAALNKTATGPKTQLAQTYQNIDSGIFGRYSSELGFLYTKYKEAVILRNESCYKDDDDYNMYLRKIYQFVILEHFNYFNLSTQYLNSVLAIRKKYSV